MKQVPKWSSLAAVVLLTAIATLGNDVKPAMANGDPRYAQVCNGGTFDSQAQYSQQYDPQGYGTYGDQCNDSRRDGRRRCNSQFGNGRNRQWRFNGFGGAWRRGQFGQNWQNGRFDRNGQYDQYDQYDQRGQNSRNGQERRFKDRNNDQNRRHDQRMNDDERDQQDRGSN